MTEELRKRVITGGLGGAAFLGLILWGGRFGITLIAVLISLGALWEYLQIILKLPDMKEKRQVLMGTSWLVMFLNFWMPRVEFELLVISFICLFTYFLFTSTRHTGEAFEHHFREWVYSFFGLFYVIFVTLYLPLLSDAGYGPHWTVIFFLIIWAGDTGGYFAGRKYGKRKLFPTISPNKTWEGFYGGLAASLVVTLLYKVLVFQKMSWIAAFLTPIIVGSVAPIGDLAESFLKRAYHLKDSGSILPGHGGILDRFDAVLFGLPVMYACIRALG